MQSKLGPMTSPSDPADNADVSACAENDSPPTTPSAPPAAEFRSDEFIDEPPGSYLAELSSGTMATSWAALTLVTFVVLTWLGSAGGVGSNSQWFALCRLFWHLVPLVAGIVLVTILWHGVSAYTRSTPRRTFLGLLLALITLAGWFVVRWVFPNRDLFAS